MICPNRIHILQVVLVLPITTTEGGTGIDTYNVFTIVTLLFTAQTRERHASVDNTKRRRQYCSDCNATHAASSYFRRPNIGPPIHKRHSSLVVISTSLYPIFKAQTREQHASVDNIKRQDNAVI